MLDTILRRSVRLARFAAPDPVTAWRVWNVRRSGLFDRTFYLGVNPGLHPIYRAFPERHYVLFGEAAGLRPSAGFSPEAYLAQNADLRGQRSPFVHYVRHGHAEGRIARDPSVDPAAPGDRPPVLRPPEAPPGSDLAAVVHVFYPELWDEIRDALRASGLAFDLFVTVAHRGEASAALIERVREEWPEARVVPMPNRGRDILPFIHLVNAGLLEPYRAVCKLHTKRSPHRQDGEVWRRHLIAGLLEPRRVRERLRAFLEDDEAAIWIADGQAYEGRVWWGVNEARVTALLRRIEVLVDARALRFPAGSMYWIKPSMLRMVRGLGLRPEEFEIEQAQLDGTLAHAVERAMGYVASASGQAIRQTSEIDAAIDATDAGGGRARGCARYGGGRRLRAGPALGDGRGILRRAAPLGRRARERRGPGRAAHAHAPTTARRSSRPSTCRSSTARPRTTPGGAAATPNGGPPPARAHSSRATPSPRCPRPWASTTSAGRRSWASRPRWRSRPGSTRSASTTTGSTARRGAGGSWRRRWTRSSRGPTSSSPSTSAGPTSPGGATGTG